MGHCSSNCDCTIITKKKKKKKGFYFLQITIDRNENHNGFCSLAYCSAIVKIQTLARSRCSIGAASRPNFEEPRAEINYFKSSPTLDSEVVRNEPSNKKKLKLSRRFGPAFQCGLWANWLTDGLFLEGLAPAPTTRMSRITWLFGLCHSQAFPICILSQMMTSQYHRRSWPVCGPDRRSEVT